MASQAKMTDQQQMKCISKDKQANSVFLDLEEAYEARMISAKDFFQTMDSAAGCPQLKKGLQKLHSSLISKLHPSTDIHPSYESSGSAPSSMSFDPPPPNFDPPPPFPDSPGGPGFFE